MLNKEQNEYKIEGIFSSIWCIVYPHTIWQMHIGCYIMYVQGVLSYKEVIFFLYVYRNYRIVCLRKTVTNAFWLLHFVFPRSILSYKEVFVFAYIYTVITIIIIV